MLRSLPAAVTVLIYAAGSLLLNVRGASTVEIVTFVGQTVILPCKVQDKNVLDLDWIKKDGTKHGAIAFAYANGCEKPDKHDNFTHRSQLFLKELEGGNMSLRLSDVRRSDAGTYTCTRRDDSAVITCTVELSVGAASEPTLAMVPGEDVTLQCEASCWSPKPDVTFLDAEGNVISAEEPKYSQDPQSDCYSVTRRATVQAGNNFTCRVNQSEIGQTRKTEIHIPECDSIFAVIGDPFEIPAFKERELKRCELMRLRGHGSVHLVAPWDDRWTPGPDYRDRMTANGTVIFNGANLNDEGLYELICATDTHRFHLHVFVSTTYTVTEGDSVPFECYAKTEGELGHFTVQRDREPVFGLDYRSGNQSPGAGFQGRVSVPPQWRTTGNLTMTLKGATTGDEGVYWFYVQHEDKSGLKVKLFAVRLKVNKRVPDPTPSGPVVPENQIRTPEAVYIAIAFLGGVVLGVVGCKAHSSLLRYLKTRRSRARPDVASHPDAGAQLLNGNSAGQIPEESKV
ncbi:uncharacterized protein LOC119222969 [Pungitius pungitius]|uniref:uncharacterized protein LOC119222969 n=1 Tax=Pungitius pungitius TaxID=134920 RepID=UPI002E0E0F05